MIAWSRGSEAAIAPLFAPLSERWAFSSGFTQPVESHPIRLGMRKYKSIASSPQFELEWHEFVYDGDFAHLFAVLLYHAQCDFDAA